MSTNVDPKLIQWLREVDTPTLSNAVELLRVRPHSSGFAPLQIRCLFPEFGRMCGFAVTAQVETRNEAYCCGLGSPASGYTKQKGR